MKVTKLLMIFGIIGIVILMLAAGNAVLSQSSGESLSVLPAFIDEDELPPEESVAEPGEIEEVQDTDFILAQPPYTMNYQGYLTDSAGVPLNGSYNMVFRMFDALIAGTLEWGPETHNNVQVNNGLFQVTLGTNVALAPHVFDEALFLAVRVNGTNVTPRQPLHSVPYAFGLVPGAKVQGDPEPSSYALWVENIGTDPADTGLYVAGEHYGIFAEEVGAGNVGIYTPDYMKAGGYQSSRDSYVWVPGNAGVLYPTSGCQLYPFDYGMAKLECSSAGTTDIYIPITVPGVLFGQNVRVESISVYYDLDHAASYIDHTSLYRMVSAQSAASLVSSAINRTSTSPTSYALAPTANYTLTAASGALNLSLTIYHDGNLDHDVYIAGARLRLGHTD